MDSESPLPAKRLRASLNGNFQVTECIREFKLPRQYPSMVTKPSTDVNREKVARQNYHASAVAALSKLSHPAKNLQNKETTLVPNLMRKIKLKAKDGRDLGEVNVQHLPQNIQGKTICLSKNGLNKHQPEVVQVAERSKGITIGVLTPVNVVKADPIILTPESHALPITCVAKINNNKFVDAGHDGDPKKVMIVDQKNVSTVTDSQGRPQVLVFQSGKSWHMVKVASAAPPTVVKAVQGKKSVVVGKWPQFPTVGKVAASGGQNQISSSAASLHNSGEVSSTLANKVTNSNQSSMVVKRWWQSRTPDSTTDGSKTRSPSRVEGSETSKPKIEVCRIFRPSNAKENSQAQTRLPTENGKATSKGSDSSSQKSTPLKQDVMVVLPGDSSVSLDEDSGGETEDGKTSGCSVDKAAGAWRRKFSVSNGGGDGSKHSRCLTSAKRGERKSVDNRDKEENTQLRILEKALSSVEDEELRAKALKVLAECGIGMERLVPIKPASDKKSVKDSDTQTSVFGLWDPEEFVCVPKDGPGIQRKRPIVRQPPLNVANVVGNAHSQDLTLHGFESPSWSAPANSMLNEWIGEWLKDSDDATMVQNMLEKTNLNPVRPEVVEQVQEDFKTYNKYDEDGLLNIHRAVISDQPRTVLRHLKVLKACRESVDLQTADGKTSLELAVSCKVSLKIVKMLLEDGAEPTGDGAAHDSALIIASKKSLPVLMELIPFVSPRESLDNYDSSGFAALHHCAQNGYEAGVKALVEASANIDLRDGRSGRTALFHAVENEHMEIAQILLDNGAQPNITNYSGHSVANLIDESKHYSFAETLNRLAK